MANKEKRSIKVYEQSGHNYKPTPTITLKGQWLKALGFDIGDYICVSCEKGRLVITQDAERSAIEKAEAEFMERETKALMAKFETEKRKRHMQFVAENNVGCGACAE